MCARVGRAAGERIIASKYLPNSLAANLNCFSLSFVQAAAVGRMKFWQNSSRRTEGSLGQLADKCYVAPRSTTFAPAERNLFSYSKLLVFSCCSFIRSFIHSSTWPAMARSTGARRHVCMTGIPPPPARDNGRLSTCAHLTCLLGQQN